MALEILETNPDRNLLESEFQRLLGYPANFVVNDSVRRLMDSTRQWYNENGKPWIYFRQINSFDISTEQFLLDGTSFISERVVTELIRSHGNGMIVAAVSAGKNCEERARQLWLEQKPDEYFFMEVFGSAMVEHLIGQTAGRICEWADQQSIAVLPRYSPGYPDWDIRQQRALYNVIVRGKGTSFPEEIFVIHSGMLNPKKSLLSVFGLSKNGEKINNVSRIPCANCSLPNCRFRREGYHSVSDVNGEIDPLRSHEEVKSNTPILKETQYSFNKKALEKWSKERLRLSINSDKTMNAVFRYDGTTCSNMGRPLAFDYHIKVEPKESQYSIINATCSPSEGDSGYTMMCRFVESPGEFMSDIAEEKPLLGKPLDDVFSWKREYNPSACYCRSESRQYKWGLVFEVLHYALARLDKQ